MFARFKTPDGKEVNVIPYRVIGVAEVDAGTVIYADGGLQLLVSDSVRKVRSTLTKLSHPGSAAAAGEEQAPEAVAEAA